MNSANAVFVILWVGLAPLAVARATKDIAEERVFLWLRAFIERKFRNSLLDYMINCKVCVSHWVCLFFCMLFYPKWIDIAVWTGLTTSDTLPVAIIMWLATTELATIRYSD